MSRVEELFEILPAEITVDGEQYKLSITKNDYPEWAMCKYNATYGRWSNTSEKCPEGFPADVFCDDDIGPGWEYSISLDKTLEGALEDLFRRVKFYIPDENGVAPITKMNIKTRTTVKYNAEENKYE